MTPALNTITLNTFFIFNSIIFLMTGWKRGSKGGKKAGGPSGWSEGLFQQMHMAEPCLRERARAGRDSPAAIKVRFTHWLVP